ncbi:MAG: molybdopterin-guanine dinucleotide biosynthesis protein B [Chloroflexota bacterium]|nr:molybdopterin-guanine dinucleotide biosynthesis protein B [Chloroflexota bacterium]
MIPVISVVGWHNVGKTGFVVALVEALKQRGLRVATIKHTRGSFDLDQPGTDTWRHAQAGSDVVVISGQSKLAFIERRECELPLDDIVARLPADIDLVITEGYKGGDKPKIEITSEKHERARIASPDELIALIDQEDVANSGQRFDAKTIDGIVGLLEQKGFIGLPGRG